MLSEHDRAHLFRDGFVDALTSPIRLRPPDEDDSPIGLGPRSSNQAGRFEAVEHAGPRRLAERRSPSQLMDGELILTSERKHDPPCAGLISTSWLLSIRETIRPETC